MNISAEKGEGGVEPRVRLTHPSAQLNIRVICARPGGQQLRVGSMQGDVLPYQGHVLQPDPGGQSHQPHGAAECKFGLSMAEAIQCGSQVVQHRKLKA